MINGPKIFRGTLIAATLAIIVVAGFAVSPAGARRATVVFTIEKGMSLRDISQKLESEGLARSGFAFRAACAITGLDKKIKAGDYPLSPSMGIPGIIRALASGESSRSCFTVVEGDSIATISRKLDELGYGPAESFAALAGSESFTKSLGVSAGSLEGYLFPETYCAPRGAEPEKLLKMMVEEYRRKLPAGAERDAAALGLSIDKIIILASIIEKEAAADDERALVSSALHNRLKAGMPLQSCATVIYALGNKYDGDLNKSDLSIDSPYNTYSRGGLPPGPISSPGLKSISAALHPAETDYLYFVSTNNGRHIFSATYNEHIAAAREYQTIGGSAPKH